MVRGSGNQIAKMRTDRKKTTSRKTAGGPAYLWCIVGSCLTLFPTFLRSSENTISGVRSKNPISRRQLVPHLQWNRPRNCCFILRPQFGQIRLLAPIAPPFNIKVQLQQVYSFSLKMQYFLRQQERNLMQGSALIAAVMQ